MVKWIVLAVVVFAFVVLALAARPVLVRLPRLHRAALKLQQRQEQAESLVAGAETLQQRVTVLQQQSETMAQRLAVINAKRGN